MPGQVPSAERDLSVAPALGQGPSAACEPIAPALSLNLAAPVDVTRDKRLLTLVIETEPSMSWSLENRGVRVTTMHPNNLISTPFTPTLQRIHHS